MRSKFRPHKWWIATILLTVPVVVLAAGVPFSFAPGKVISSSDMNMNFASITSRLDTLEAALQKRTRTTVVMDNVAGSIGNSKSATFTTAGGDLQIVVSGSAWTGKAHTLAVLAVQFDGNPLGQLEVFIDETTSHRAFPAKVFGASVGAGTHVITVSAGNVDTNIDYLDYYNVVVFESFH